MSRIKKMLLFLRWGCYSLLLLAPSFCFAQYENVWAFGFGGGLDFNSGFPLSISTSIKTNEGSASICDSNGRLLFYTDGTFIWDRNHTLMPNGIDLTGRGLETTTSTTQGTLIVPMPGNKDLYYVFSLGSVESSASGMLFYSIVDIKLNGGLGDVSTGKKAIALDSRLTEKMIAIPGEDCNVWLLVVPLDGNKVRAYNIGLEGIQTDPVISDKYTGDNRIEILLGWMTASVDYSKVVIGKGLYPFSRTTGKVGKPIILPVYQSYGVCFSPDDSKLYFSSEGPTFQFNLSSGDSATIVKSKTAIGPQNTAMKRGPDHKIYITASEHGRMSVIPFPNLAGTACGYWKDTIRLSPEAYSYASLPNYVVHATDREGKFHTSRTDTAFCTDRYTLRPGNSSGMNYTWSNGTTGTTLQVTASGTYWVHYQTRSICTLNEYVDTIRVLFDSTPRKVITVTREQLMCKADTLSLHPKNLTGTNYVWDDRSTEHHRRVNLPATYWVNYQIDSLCFNNTDSFIVSYTDEVYKVSFEVDTLLCEQEVFAPRNTSAARFNQWNWDFGDGQQDTLFSPQHQYPKAGAYTLRLIGTRDRVCKDTAWQKIVIDAPVPISYATDRDSICIGTAIHFSPGISSETLSRLIWNFGDDTSLDTTGNGPLSHAYAISGSLLANITAIFRACPDQTYTRSIFVSPLPVIDLGADNNLCFKGAPIYLSNTRTEPTSSLRYLWSTGATTPTLKVLQPGEYSLTLIAEPLGCTNTETVLIRKDCYLDIPNAFTPNGDGFNDYFFPRQLLSTGVVRFQFQVFNRLGQMVFETVRADGRGWDGNFNNQKQPGGVYIYQMTAVLKNGYEEKYAGNVTLIR